MNIIYSGMFFSITEEDFNWYERTYPGVGIASELRKADMWLRCNPRRRKKNYPRFLTAWLARAHSQLLAVELRQNVRAYRAKAESRVGTYEHAPVRVNPRLLRQA
jgi:hypothetical protein